MKIPHHTRFSSNVPQVPGQFKGVPEKYTKSKMIEYRKKEAIPDISYDLDNDGFVGGRDYVVARHFDNGLKNYLTEEEKVVAYKAISEVSDLFVFQLTISLL